MFRSAAEGLRRLRRRWSERRIRGARRAFARGRLAGKGLEIGALDSPFPLPPGAAARNVDRLSREQLRHHYPEIESARLVPVDLVDDGEKLATVPTASQDFVVASHVLEHCQDPLGTLATWCRVVRPGGAILLAVPDRRFTFDRQRAPTPLAHPVADRADGGAGSRSGHYREWAERVEGLVAEAAESRAAALEQAGYSIHFHVWDADGLAELLRHFAAQPAPAVVLEALARNRSENLALLRRSVDPGSDRLGA